MNALRTPITRLAALLAALSAALGPIAVPAAAQGKVTPVCMSKETSGSPRGDQAFTLILAPRQVAKYAARGFTEVPCNGKEEKLPQVLDRICALAARPDDTGAGAFQAVYGVSAAEICELAREVAGMQ